MIKRVTSVIKGHNFGNTTPDIKYNMDSLSRQSGNYLGSSNLSVNTNGTLVNREEYYPFGETSFGSYAKKRYRFCGKEKDEESGLYYYGARYYSPWTCRFISVDPLEGKYAQLTPYNYAGNEPIGDKDIDGMQSEKTPTSQGSSPSSAGNTSAQNQTQATNINCHQVKAGETLEGIAKNNNTSVDALRKANNLEPQNDKKLQIGSNLKIPVQKAAGQSSALSAKFNFTKLSKDNTTVVPMPLSKSNFSFSYENSEIGFDGKPTGKGGIEQNNIIFEVILAFSTIGFFTATRVAIANIGVKKGFEFAAKGVVQAEKVSGSYLLEFQSGKLYAEKGLEPRMMQSINRMKLTLEINL